MIWAPDRLLAHTGIPGPAPLIATGLFLSGMGAAYGAYWFHLQGSDLPRRTASIGLGVTAFVCLVVATTLPLFLGARPMLGRPPTTAKLAILSPTPGEVIPGDAASIAVQLSLEGGKVVPTTSFHLVANEGHIHLYLDGSLVSMPTGLVTTIAATPGRHELRAEFVAIDHGPFQPRVTATVAFVVQG